MFSPLQLSGLTDFNCTSGPRGLTACLGNLVWGLVGIFCESSLLFGCSLLVSIYLLWLGSRRQSCSLSEPRQETGHFGNVQVVVALVVRLVCIATFVLIVLLLVSTFGLCRAFTRL